MDTIPEHVEAAVEQYILSLNITDSAEQAELRRFERWLGKTKKLSSLRPLDIEHYGERFSQSDPDCSNKLDIIRKFLTYARNKTWTAANLSVHLKAKKSKVKAGGMTRNVRPELSVLTQQGYDDILTEVATLKSKRPQVLEELRRAAADKDFRENAPLHAAREQLGHIDGRIQELSAIIKSANIIGERNEDRGRVAPGNTVSMVEESSGLKISYTIVGPKEANPAQGKISYVSPIGKAVIGKAKGDVVEVASPSGRRSYRIENIQKA